MSFREAEMKMQFEYMVRYVVFYNGFTGSPREMMRVGCVCVSVCSVVLVLSCVRWIYVKYWFEVNALNCVCAFHPEWD